MIDAWLIEIRKWLFEGKKKTIIGGCLIWFAVNAAVWQVLEPSNIITHIPHYPIYHYISVTVFSLIILRLIYPAKFLEALNIEKTPNDFKPESWKPIAKPDHKVEIIDDDNYGKTLHFEGTSTSASRFPFKDRWHKAKRLTIISHHQEQFQLYIEGLVHVDGQEVPKSVLLSLMETIESPVKTADSEWSIPVKPVIRFNKWAETTVDLERTVRKGLGTSSYIFIEVQAIQVKGNGDVNAIFLYR